jgi:glycosyltransferase involved in cell wall biosynthesis
MKSRLRRRRPPNPAFGAQQVVPSTVPRASLDCFHPIGRRHCGHGVSESDRRQMSPRIAIAHEWLVRYAGSERCVEQMLEAFPDAELLTTVVVPAALPAPLRRARPSLLQRVPGSRTHHEWFLPLMPLAWRLRDPVQGADVVISSSHACAKAVRTEPGVPHLCYCHTPMRYAWDFESERDRFPRLIRPLARAGMSWFRRWDRETAARVTSFVANSTAVARRIEKFFGREAAVIHPPVRTDFFTPGGERKMDFLYVGRLVGYKRAADVVDAFAKLPEHTLLVVGEGPLAGALRARATPNVRFLGSVDEERLRDLYRSARALVYPAEEDFGIAMAEAQACGTPVIGLAAGGATDIVSPGRTGWLVRGESVEELRAAIRLAATEELDGAKISAAAQRFSASRFRHEIREAVLACAGGRAVGRRRDLTPLTEDRAS